MLDLELIRDILTRILWSIDTVSKRFATIRSPGDFLSSDEGIEKLDSICMQLIAIGESVKQLDRVTEGQLLVKFTDIAWRRIAGMRDILSHHYFDIDADVVYEVCSVHFPVLRTHVYKDVVGNFLDLLADAHPALADPG